jgi:hypothetical protein
VSAIVPRRLAHQIAEKRTLAPQSQGMAGPFSILESEALARPCPVIRLRPAQASDAAALDGALLARRARSAGSPGEQGDQPQQYGAAKQAGAEFQISLHVSKLPLQRADLGQTSVYGAAVLTGMAIACSFAVDPIDSRFEVFKSTQHLVDFVSPCALLGFLKRQKPVVPIEQPGTYLTL